MISLYGLAAGLLCGWFRRGRVGALADVRLRLWGLCIAALAMHRLLPVVVQGSWAQEMDAVTFYALLAAFAAVNRVQPGAYFLLAGVLANAVPTLMAGGRMPVWTAVLGRIPPRTARALLAGENLTHVAMAHPVGPGWLGDVLAVPAPLPADVISFGDIAVAAGAAVFLAVSMAPRRDASSALPS